MSLGSSQLQKIAHPALGYQQLLLLHHPKLAASSPQLMGLLFQTINVWFLFLQKNFAVVSNDPVSVGVDFCRALMVF